MNPIAEQKEKVINDYFSLLNLEDIENLDIEKIKNELHQALNEKPAVKLNYENDVVKNEDTGEEERISNMKSITVYYTYEERNNFKSGQKTYIIG